MLFHSHNQIKIKGRSTQQLSLATKSKGFVKWGKWSKWVQRHLQQISLRKAKSYLIPATRFFKINSHPSMKRKLLISRTRNSIQLQTANHQRRMMMTRKTSQKSSLKIITWFNRLFPKPSMRQSESRVRFKTMTQLELVKPRSSFQILWKPILNTL